MARLTSDNELYKSIVEALPLPAAIYTGVDLIVRDVNFQMICLLGPNNVVIDKPIFSVASKFADEFTKVVADVISTGSIRKVEWAGLEPVSGKLIYHEHCLQLIEQSGSNRPVLLHTATDVTPLANAKQKLLEIEDQLRFAVSAAELGIWDINLLTKVVHWDMRCRELFGYGPDQSISFDDVVNVVYEEDRDFVQKHLDSALIIDSGEAYDIRHRIINQNTHDIKWVHYKGKAYFNADGTAYRFVGTIQDISNEIKLKLREQQLLSLVEHNIDHMSISNMDGGLIYLNEAARTLLGVRLDADVTQYRVEDFYSPEESKRIQENLALSIDNKNGWQGSINLKNIHSGEYIPCYVSFILIRDGVTGEVIGRGATARDMRPEIKAKAELQRLAIMVDTSEDFCNYCDLEGNTIYINRAGLKLIGMKSADLLTSSLYEYHSERSVKTIREIIMPQLLSLGKWSGPLELIHQQTAELIPIHMQFFIIRQEITNTPIALAGIARDLRPEIKANKAIDFKNTQLQIAIRELEFLANSVPVVVWTSNPQGQLDYINQRWYERSPIAIDKALGSGWTQILHPDDEKRIWKAWQDSIKTGEPFQIEFRLLDKYGEYRWWMVRAIALKDDLGRVIKWYGSNIDITDQKELERQKDNFLGVASHELKTPVTSIKAYAQVMEMMFRRAGDVKNAELLVKMDSQINKLNNLIGDLLQVTKINTGRLQFNESAVDFNAMVEEVIEEVQRTAVNHQIHKDLRFKKEILGDKDRICQVITNLLTNAIKYSPNAARVIISTAELDGAVQLSVQDFGIGIRPDEQDRIFGQFYRVSGSREHTFPGLGLGLYISAEIIKHLNGRIWVESAEGQGSIFCFSLPLIIVDAGL